MPPVAFDNLETVIQPIAFSLECELWGIHFIPQGERSVLRVYIDKINGVSIDDCAKVSRAISAVLDVENPIVGHYVLEVSSPGMARPLFTLKHYMQCVGQRVKLRLRAPFEGQRKYQGLLLRIEQDTREICMVCDQHEFLFPFETVEKAYVVPHYLEKKMWSIKKIKDPFRASKYARRSLYE